MGFKLFELPLELRLTIYRHLFSGRNLCIKFIQYRNIGSLRCPPSPRRAVEKAEARENHEVTAIIHVCQQIRDEATPTLFANVALISGDLKGLEPMRSVFGSHNVASIQCVEVTVEQLAIRFTACFPELRVLTVHHDKTYHNGSAPADYMWREMHKLLSKYEADSLKTLQYGGRYKVYYRFIVSGAKVSKTLKTERAMPD